MDRIRVREGIREGEEEGGRPRGGSVE